MPDGTPARASTFRRISAAISIASPSILTLAGLLSLVVGGVGVANAAQGFVERKRATLAILKAIGATGSGVVMPRARRIRDRGADWRARRRRARLGDSVRWSLGCSASLLPIPLAPSIAPGVIGLGLIYGLLTALAFSVALARARARSAGDDADPRHGRGTPGLASQALPWPCGARRSGAGRARRLDQPATVDRGDGRRGDGRRVLLRSGSSPSPSPASPAARPVALRRVAHGARSHP